MSQLQKKFLANNSVDENKIRLSNAGSLKARNAADSGDVNILSVDASDRIVFASVPQAAADASADNDLVRYSQFAGALEGVKPKEAVRVATTAAGTLATDFANGSTVDGVVLATGDRILIKDQASSAENGIYVVAASGAPTRAADFNAVSEIPGSYTVAQAGTANTGITFVCLSTPAVLDTDPILFTKRAIAAYTGGDMITLTGSDFSVDLATSSGLESSNPGNAAGQLQIKLEASNPSLQIDGSNQLGAKLDSSRSTSSDANGIGVDLNASGGLEHATGIAINLEASNPTLQIDGSNQLGAKLDAAGAIITGASGLAVQPDSATVKINGSNQVESLKRHSEIFTLNGTDITNQYVDLAKVAHGADANDNSVNMFVVGGPMQLKGTDYTVSLTGGSGGVTRITFAGDLATSGAAELIAGDKLVVECDFLT